MSKFQAKIPLGDLDQSFDKKCDSKKSYDIHHLNRDLGYKLKSTIQSKEFLDNNADKNGIYHYSHPFCIDVYCAYKDKCKRTKKNLNNLRQNVANDESSSKFLQALETLVNNTNDLQKLKLIEEESQRCGLLRELYDEFCKSTSNKSYIQPTSIINNQVVYGDEGHAYQHKSFNDIALNAGHKIKSLNSSNISIQPSKRVVKSFLSNNKQRRNSSVYKSIKRSEAKRKNGKKS